MSLIELSLSQFARQVASGSPTPGGGCVVALAGALSAALCGMVARLTLGREKYRSSWEFMANVEHRSEELVSRLLKLVDQDAEAYGQVMAAFGLPKTTHEQKLARKRRIDDAARQAAVIPMKTLEILASISEMLPAALEYGNTNCLTDVGVAVNLTLAAAVGATYNVRVNLAGIEDRNQAEAMVEQAEKLLSRIETRTRELSAIIEERLRP